MLRINKDGLLKEFMSHFFEELAWVLDQWKSDVEKFASSTIRELGVPKADTKKVIDEAGKMITIYFQANPTLLADIYGTGSKMENERNPKFQEYWNNVGSGFGQRNPKRTSIDIQGRPEGEYYTIFNSKKSRKAKGKNVGDNIEGGNIRTIEPNRKLLEEYFGTAIEIANNFFKYSYLQRAINQAIKDTEMYKYIEEVN